MSRWTSFRDFWFALDNSDLQASDTSKRSRVGTVRDALIQAGGPAHRIQTGAFGDQGRRRDRLVEVLISTSN